MLIATAAGTTFIEAQNAGMGTVGAIALGIVALFLPVAFSALKAASDPQQTPTDPD